MKDKVFSRNQFLISVVPTSELTHTNANTIIKANNQRFFLNGVLSFEMAIVKLINICFEWWNLNIQNKKPRPKRSGFKGSFNNPDQLSKFLLQVTIYRI